MSEAIPVDAAETLWMARWGYAMPDPMELIAEGTPWPEILNTLVAANRLEKVQRVGLYSFGWKLKGETQ